LISWAPAVRAVAMTTAHAATIRRTNPTRIIVFLRCETPKLCYDWPAEKKTLQQTAWAR
jgi:hypothetical protein